MCLRDILEGETSDDTERLWRKAYGATAYVGRRGIMMDGLGRKDLVLRDLFVQLTGMPVSSLIGGRKWERIPAYGTTRDSLPGRCDGGAIYRAFPRGQGMKRRRVNL